MSIQEWEQNNFRVRDAMAEFVWPMTCPMAAFDRYGRGYAWATGNFVQLRNAIYLLTNAHVFSQASDQTIAYLPSSEGDYVAISRADLAPWPTDLGLSRLDLTAAPSPSTFVEPHQFDCKYAPAESELLFWVGYPGSTAERHEFISDLRRRTNWFDASIESPAVPFLSQEVQDLIPSLGVFRPTEHVVVHYPAQAMRSAGDLANVPNPKGMSGSLLWDTKFVASLQSGGEWLPSQAKVCGLVWAAHENPEVIVATRIESVIPAMLKFLRQDDAYHRWKARGCKDGRALDDWLAAESSVQGLL